MYRRSAAICSRPPGANTCAGHAALAFFTCDARCCSASNRRCSTWTPPDSYAIRADARRFENWETNYAGKIGLGVAIDYAMQWGLDSIWRRVRNLAYQLRTQLSPLPGVIVHDRGVTQCGIVTFTVEGLEPAAIKERLAARHINVTVAVRESTLLDLAARGLTSMVRASVHYYNTEEEIERFCAALAEMI